MTTAAETPGGNPRSDDAFLTIGVAWLAHTALTDRLAHTDPIFLRLNLLLLLAVVYLPFPDSAHRRRPASHLQRKAVCHRAVQAGHSSGVDVDR